MRTLTIGEEIRILKELTSLHCIDEGSSRIVYDCSDELVSFLKLNSNKDYVIKLAVGSGGYVQNHHEIDTYNSYDEYYFAEIAAYGHFIIIMEKVDTDEWRDFAEGICDDDDAESLVEDYCDYDWNNATPEQKRKLELVARTVIYLAGIYGTTSDNGQVGWTSDGRCVAYDFGFVAEEGCDTQCSSELVDNIQYDKTAKEEYICSLIAVLHDLMHVRLQLDSIFGRIASIETNINYDRR